MLKARDSEYKAWACIQSLKSSLDEHNLELRVKTAIEAEASSQQRLAMAEAEIADLRQKLEASKRSWKLLKGLFYIQMMYLNRHYGWLRESFHNLLLFT